MSLVNLSKKNSSLKYSSLLILILFAFMLIGCGESEEMTMDEQGSQVARPAGSGDVEQPKEEKPMDQALSSFIGSEADQPSEAAPAPAPVPAVSPTQLALYEKQIEDLRTENTSLKQKIVTLEQENRGINARMNEVEAKYAAEKLRADKADELTKGVAVAPKVIEEQPKSGGPIPVSMSTYENAIQAFKSKKYDEAQRGFKAIVDGDANDDLFRRATYWLGETYYAKKRYKEALNLFQETLKFKSSEKKADAQFMLAQTYERLGNKAKAKAAYEKVVKNYPMSKNVKRAKERWARL